ncbi:helix-turn-helix domain-containing protein, partial [Prochlorothrix hollandica]|uniref:helix-turn-helix domain-containing protein n=1 Tax=Prochlorothrix hollandica TaxID=1223 RepID=UPI0005C4DFE4
MKVRYQYRIYPTPQQVKGLNQLFGCCRVVYNDALAIVRSVPQGEKWPSNAELQKLVITQAKKTAEREWLADVSVVPLQQSVQDLGAAFKNFLRAVAANEKGQRWASL